MKIVVFWVATSTVSVVRCQSFGGYSSLHLQHSSDKLQAEFWYKASRCVLQ
jgi:hypothetical protein